MIRSIEPGKHTVAIARDGAWTSAVVDADVLSGLEEVAIRTAGSKVKLQLATVESHLGHSAESKREAAIVAAYLSDMTIERMSAGVAYVHPVDLGVARYQFATTRYDCEAKPGLTAFMSPLIGPSPAPDLCRANDERCIDKRVKSIRPEKLELTDFMTRTMVEFARCVVPDHLVHTGIPTSFEHVYERQPRATQQAILQQAY